jgi:hypothetical protein
MLLIEKELAQLFCYYLCVFTLNCIHILIHACILLTSWIAVRLSILEIRYKFKHRGDRCLKITFLFWFLYKKLVLRAEENKNK